MAKNAFRQTDELPADAPRELQLDLLVDGELPEARRRDLLASLDRQPGQWRDLALRFLQQQTEKQSVRGLMAGGKLIPVEIDPPQIRRPVIGRVGWYRLTAIAAGLFIAVGSALITLLVVRPLGPNQSLASAAEFHTSLPQEVTQATAALPVSVPIVPASDTTMIFPAGMRDNNRPTKTTLIVQPDGKGGYMVIPVSMTKSPVY